MAAHCFVCLLTAKNPMKQVNSLAHTYSWVRHTCSLSQLACLHWSPTPIGVIGVSLQSRYCVPKLTWDWHMADFLNVSDCWVQTDFDRFFLYCLARNTACQSSHRHHLNAIKLTLLLKLLPLRDRINTSHHFVSLSFSIYFHLWRGCVMMVITSTNLVRVRAL